MSISMYQSCVPRIVNMMINLDHLLDKDQTHIHTKKLSEAALTQFRLAALSLVSLLEFI
jgi:hypothetical protein